MKTVLVVLLILAAGAGAWFSGLSGVFGINGQYQDFKEMIAYRKVLDKEIRDWTGLRNDMIKNRGRAAEENLSLISNKASVTQQRDEQLSKSSELKEEEVKLNADLSKINQQVQELKAQLSEFGVSSVEEIQARMEATENANKKLQEEIDKQGSDGSCRQKAHGAGYRTGQSPEGTRPNTAPRLPRTAGNTLCCPWIPSGALWSLAPGRVATLTRIQFCLSPVTVAVSAS